MPAYTTFGLGFLSRIGAFLNSLPIGYGRILLTIVAVVVSWRIVYAFFFSPLRSIRGPKLARLTPLRAIYNRFPSRVIEAALADYRAYGDLYVSKPNTVTLSHPQDVRAVLGAPDARKIDVYHGLNDPIMANLVTFSVPGLASRRRRQLGPYFTHGYLARMEPLILRNGVHAIKAKWDRMIEQQGGTAEVNYRQDIQLATFSIMSALAFGRDCNSLETGDSTVMDWVAATAVYVAVRINFNFLMKIPFSLLIRRWIKQHNDFVQYGKESVANRKEMLAANPGEQKPADMLQAFIDAEDPESKGKMTSVEVQAESVGMQLAGSETTAASLTWCLHLLTLYPEHLRRVVDEVRQFPLDHLITYSDCRTSLPFLESFIYEMLRYTPITSGFMPRILAKGITLQNQYLPPGTQVAFNLIALNNREDCWQDPDKFIPDRFMGNEDAKRNIFAFSYGPRNCIGKNLAWLEMVTILANLLKDYDVAAPEDAVYGPQNVDERGLPRVMPSKCHIVFTPTNPDRDCRIVISKCVD